MLAIVGTEEYLKIKDGLPIPLGVRCKLGAALLKPLRIHFERAATTLFIP